MSKTSPMFDHYLRPLESLKNQVPGPPDWAAYTQSLRDLMDEKLTIGDIDEDRSGVDQQQVAVPYGETARPDQGYGSEPRITDEDIEETTDSETRQ